VAAQASPAQQKASWIFTQWATSEAIARPYVEAGGVSGRMAVYKDPAVQAKFKYVNPMVASWQQGVPEFRPRFPAWSSITEVVAEFGSKMMLGEVSIDQGAKEIGTRMEETLATEGYYNGKKKKLQ
jgi:multiple sugar transport system substrate-binding protein